MVKQVMPLFVRRVTYEAEDINSYELVDPDGGELPEFTPGAHLDINFRDGRVRQYSISSPSSDRMRYRIGVLKIRPPNGRGGSMAVFERVHVGRVVSIGGPRNNFLLDETAKKSMFIAGGVGITPLLCMLHRLEDIGADFVLHYCAKAKKNVAFSKELKKFEADGKVIFHLDGGDPKRGINLKKELADPEEGTHLYFCGPPGLMGAIKKFSSHWPSGTVHYEYFGAPPASEPPVPKAGQPTKVEEHIGDLAIGVGFQVAIAGTDKSYEVPPDRSILDVLIENGHKVEKSCGAGMCGACKTRYVAGIVDHRDLVLRDEEKANYILPCVSRCSSEKLVLDLS